MLLILAARAVARSRSKLGARHVLTEIPKAQGLADGSAVDAGDNGLRLKLGPSRCFVRDGSRLGVLRVCFVPGVPPVRHEQPSERTRQLAERHQINPRALAVG